MRTATMQTTASARCCAVSSAAPSTLARALISSSALVLATLALAPVPAHAQADAAALLDTLRVRIERANAAGDVSTIAQVRALADRAVTRFPEDAWLAHYRAYAMYREVTITMGRAPDTDVGDQLEATQEALESALAKRDVP